MGNFNLPFLDKTKEFVAGFIGENFSEKICYHNIDHTLEVVEASEMIGHQYKISDVDMETLLIAAWFHDTGYYLGCQNHEEASAKIAQKFLQSHNIDSNIIKQVTNCILSTKLPQKPTTLLEKILCDADLFHLSSEHFLKKSQLLLHEILLRTGEISQKKWMMDTLDFISAHTYHTEYCQRKLGPLQKKNVDLLLSKVD